MYAVFKCWVTSNRAEKANEDIKHELVEEMRHLMHLSGLKRFGGKAIWLVTADCARRCARMNPAESLILFISVRCVVVTYCCKCMVSLRVRVRS